MNRTLLCAFAGLAVFSAAAFAQEHLEVKQGAVPAPKIEKAVADKSSKVVRLSDAQLDKITAGNGAEVISTGLLTIVMNPGNADVLVRKPHHILCINCF